MRLQDEMFKGIERDIKKNPNNPNLWANRGVFLDNMGRYEEAIESFDKAIKISPDDSFAWTSRGITLEKLGRYEEAVESYDKSLKIDPKGWAAQWVIQIAKKNRERIKRKVAINIESNSGKFIELETIGHSGCSVKDHNWKKYDEKNGRNGPIKLFICDKCNHKAILFSYIPENNEIQEWTDYVYFQKKN